MNQEYKLAVPKTSKDLIKQPKMAEEGVLPKLHFSMLLIGSSGSGKSVLAYNLIDKYYKDCFDMIILISPTGKTDDIQKALKLPDSHVITDMEKAEIALQKIMDVQAESIKEKGFEKTKKILIYLDDVVGDSKFMNSKAMVNSFIKNRHYNFSVMLCSQYYKAIPRRMRMQSACNFFFACPETEMQTIAEDFEPPGVGRKRFIEVLQKILSVKFQFVTINMRSDWAERFRVGLAKVIDFFAVPAREEEELQAPRPSPYEGQNFQRSDTHKRTLSMVDGRWTEKQ